MTELVQAIERLRAEVQSVTAAVAVLMARQTDVTHLTIAEVARVRGITRAAVRRQFRGAIERMPGRKGDGIPIEKVFAGWLPLATARLIVTKLKKTA